MLERVDKLLKRLIYLYFGDIQWEDPGRGEAFLKERHKTCSGRHMNRRSDRAGVFAVATVL